MALPFESQTLYSKVPSVSLKVILSFVAKSLLLFLFTCLFFSLIVSDRDNGILQKDVEVAYPNYMDDLGNTAMWVVSSVTESSMADGAFSERKSGSSNGFLKPSDSFIQSPWGVMKLFAGYDKGDTEPSFYSFHQTGPVSIYMCPLVGAGDLRCRRHIGPNAGPH